MKAIDIVRAVLDAPKQRCDVCGREAVLWNAWGEWSCGAHQNWLARRRD